MAMVEQIPSPAGVTDPTLRRVLEALKANVEALATGVDTRRAATKAELDAAEKRLRAQIPKR